MLGMPSPTAYDLRFRLLGIPVRVHPLFWVMMWLLSRQPDYLPGVLAFTVVGFVSILVHEYGHGLMSRFFGEEPRSIVLYAMGGLCESPMERHTLWQRAGVLIAGPGAGFLLLGVVLLAGFAAFGLSPRNSMAAIGVGHFDLDNLRAARVRLPTSELLLDIYSRFLWINFWWGVVNLFPIWPLDGGQLATVFLTMYNPRQGRRWGHIVSLITSGLLAMWEFQRGDQYLAFYLAYFAFLNFQALQAIHEFSRDKLSDEDHEWWKR
jgi:stage IV sporulation protein FB